MVQPTLLFDFRTKKVTVASGQTPDARKAMADLLAAQRGVVAKSVTLLSTVTKS